MTRRANKVKVRKSKLANSEHIQHSAVEIPQTFTGGVSMPLCHLADERKATKFVKFAPDEYLK